MATIGYSKIGRSIQLPPSSWDSAGDNEPPVLLSKLARRNPQHTFIIVGRNTGERPEDIGLPANVINPWANEDRRAYVRDGLKRARELQGQERLAWMQAILSNASTDLFIGLDGFVNWVGQHGTSNQMIPKVNGGGVLTNPQDSFVNYAGYIIRGINDWRSEDPYACQEVHLCPDPRNYLKARDLMWPPSPIVGQYDWRKKEKHFRFGSTYDPEEFGGRLFEHSSYALPTTWAEDGVWSATHVYEYQRLETVGIPSTLECSYEWEGRSHLGIIINEARGYVKLNRLDAMRDWVMPLRPTWVYGRWSDKSAATLGITGVQPIAWHAQWDALRSVRCTFTTPSSGSHWATTKPWEAFACGTVCFFHPEYDKQDHVLTDAPRELHQWLRVKTPEELAKRVEVLSQDQDAWSWLVTEQRRLFDRATEEARCLTEIERRCLPPIT